MCWNIRYNDENAFCSGAVNWKLSENVYYDAPNRDQKAAEQYAALLTKWKQNDVQAKLQADIAEGKPYDKAAVMSVDEAKKLPKADCLAIAR